VSRRVASVDPCLLSVPLHCAKGKKKYVASHHKHLDPLTRRVLPDNWFGVDRQHEDAWWGFRKHPSHPSNGVDIFGGSIFVG